MRRFIPAALVTAVALVISGPAMAAPPSNPNCIADDVETIRVVFGGDTVGGLFAELGQMGIAADTIQAFRADACT